MPTLLSGTQTFTAGLTEATNNFSLTVPALAQAILVHASYWTSANGVPTCNIGANNFVELYGTTNGSGSAMDGSAHILVSPPTGAQTLAFVTTTGGAGAGYRVIVSYWNNVDTTTPTANVADSGSGSASNSVGVTTTSYSAPNLVIGSACNWDVTPNIDPAASGQTVVGEEAAVSNAALGVSYEDASGTTTTVSIDNGTANFGRIWGFVFRDSGGGAGGGFPVINQIYRNIIGAQ